MRPAKPKWRSIVEWLITGLLVIITIEGFSQVAYRVYKGKWYYSDRKASARTMVQPHPYLGASLVPNVSDERSGIRISHNSFRTRGPEFARPKPAGTVRIVTLGGSTTYCTGVSDNEMWQTYLNEMLGKPYEVINFANPGGTSIEATVQTALLFSEVQPDIAIYYLGWNDARVQHIKNLWPDWSDFHGKWVMSFGLSGRELEERTASGFLLKRAAFRYFFPRMDVVDLPRQIEGTEDKFTDRVDEKAMAHYVRNIRNIITLCKKQGVTPIFMPQVMNWNALTNDTPYGWLPYVRDKDLKTIIGAYNETLEKVAKEENVEFIKGVLEPDYAKTGFLDQGHMTPASNKLLARAVADFFVTKGKPNSPALSSAQPTHGQ